MGGHPWTVTIISGSRWTWARGSRWSLSQHKVATAVQTGPPAIGSSTATQGETGNHITRMATFGWGNILLNILFLGQAGIPSSDYSLSCWWCWVFLVYSLTGCFCMLHQNYPPLSHQLPFIPFFPSLPLILFYCFSYICCYKHVHLWILPYFFSCVLHRYVWDTYFSFSYFLFIPSVVQNAADVNTCRCNNLKFGHSPLIIFNALRQTWSHLFFPCLLYQRSLSLSLFVSVALFLSVCERLVLILTLLQLLISEMGWEC